MPWGLVGGATLSDVSGLIAGTTNTRTTAALGAAVSIGHRIVVAIECFSLSSENGAPWEAVAVSDSLGNTYRRDLIYGGGDGTNNWRQTIWSAPVTVPGTPTFTITRTPSTSVSAHRINVHAAAFSGLSQGRNAAYLGVGQYLMSQTSGPYDSGSTGEKTTAANELKIGYCQDSGENSTLTPGTVDTAYATAVKHDADTISQWILEYADSGPIGSTARAQAQTSAFASGDPWGAAVLVYKLADAAGPAASYPQGGAPSLQQRMG